MEGNFKPSSKKLGNVKEINILSTLYFIYFLFFNLDAQGNES